MVKRIIAVGGQTVQCQLSTGLTVDGARLAEPYLDPAAMKADPGCTPAWATSSARSRCRTAGCG